MVGPKYILHVLLTLLLTAAQNEPNDIYSLLRSIQDMHFQSFRLFPA